MYLSEMTINRLQKISDSTPSIACDVRRAAGDGGRFAQRIQRTRADVAVDDTDCAERRASQRALLVHTTVRMGMGAGEAEERPGEVRCVRACARGRRWV